MRFITTWTFNPNDPISFARYFAKVEGTVLLYSGGKLDSACHSYLCLFPEEKIQVKAKKGCWDELKEYLGTFDSPSSILKWVGFIGYEMGAFADLDIEIPCFSSEIPDALFYRPTVVIHFDHKTRQATLYGDKEISLKQPPPLSYGSEVKLRFRSDSLESYLAKIREIKNWILEGKLYQLNLSQEFLFEGKSDPFDIFQKICSLNPTAFSAYMQCGDFTIVSSSPERFLSRKGSRLETRPIKGTIPRGQTALEERLNRNRLLNSEKERAELLMITDLMRNDLGKVSFPGSVNTKEIWRCEAYTNVFHLLSIIEGRCDAEPVPLIRQLFPGGSITGCPKLSAMEAITLLEQRPRGVYTGSIGYFSAHGDFDFNIAIRTLVINSASIRLALGGAIIIDSDPMKEFEETLHKGQSLFQVLGANELCLL
ncbi:MAG: anthranilate synthase component I family protein [Chlamydiales bacterium]